MSRKKILPSHWLPEPEIADEDCTILELWSRHYEDIADHFGFQAPKTTIAAYTSHLSAIADALSQRPANKMSPYDIWDAITSVKTYGKSQKKYAESAFNGRLTVIQDTLRYCESRGILVNPLWRFPLHTLRKYNSTQLDWDLNSNDIQSIFSTHLQSAPIKIQSLTLSQEQRLVRRVLRQFKDGRCTDGRWIGLMLYLYLGLRPSEGRGLRFRDVFPFPHLRCEHYIVIVRSAASNGEDKEHLKNRNAIRSLPVHIELDTTLLLWAQQVMHDTGLDDIGDLPIICANLDYYQPCTSADICIFSKRVLKDIMSGDELDSFSLAIYSNPSEKWLDSADSSLITQLFRHNFATKTYSDTKLDDHDIRRSMGHETGDPINSDYSIPAIYERLQKMNHRMICPELRDDWYTILSEDTTSLCDVGLHYLVLTPETVERGLTIDIAMSTLEPGTSMQLELQRLLPPGSTIEVLHQSHIPAPPRSPHRINTDHGHWRLPFPDDDDID